MTANKSMAEELLDQARNTVALAVGAGADDAVASVSCGRALEFQYRADKLEKVQEDTSRSLGIALYVDGRFSTHGTNDLDPARLSSFVSEAVAITRELEPDPHRAITPPELYAQRPEVDLDLVDGTLLELSREERIAWCRQMDSEAHGHPDVISATSGVTDSSGVSARVSSNGFEGTHERTSVWYGTEVTIREDDLKRPEAWWWVGGSHQEGLPSPQDVGREALRR
ncbi:MAG TPA: TldD/PmbA family protein, partial [Deltaproteobacteria bacterium]|nr:TldD/PmbA family protein [Deltaproteobacteria bacterium]